jgi:hypothetical protein
MPPNGSVEGYSSGVPGRGMINPTYPTFDAQGNLYVSDSRPWLRGGGCSFLIAPDELWTDELGDFTNGLALSPDKQTLYMVESTRSAVVRIPIRPDDYAGPLDVVGELPLAVHRQPGSLAYRPDREGRSRIPTPLPDRRMRLHDQ